ncbi:hypothetical protein FRC09_006236 [Ceratobasidium sp. 395]|nr:hypothetical protein FRC09_006236 [Ceratobasidium sp. 395]
MPNNGQDANDAIMVEDESSDDEIQEIQGPQFGFARGLPGQDVARQRPAGIRGNNPNLDIARARLRRTLAMFFDPPNQPDPIPLEYSTDMTHSRPKPQAGFTYNFSPDEDSLTVRTRTIIDTPKSPGARPVDRKGKGRAVEAPLPTATTSGSVLAPPTKKRRREPVRMVEILSDESDTEQRPPILVCAMCRRPLRMGGDRLWALRCGHMIDSPCYRRLAESPIVQEEASDMLVEWCCPVRRCRRTHWSECVKVGGEWSWQPLKNAGAIAVFV